MFSEMPLIMLIVFFFFLESVNTLFWGPLSVQLYI